MPISRLEKIAYAALIIGGTVGGYGEDSYHKNQAKLLSPDALKAIELRDEIGTLDYRAVSNFYTRDGKGNIRTTDFLESGNRETIRQTLETAWADYDRLQLEYQQLAAKPGVQDAIKQIEKHKNTGFGYLLVGYTVTLMGATVGFWRYVFDPSRITKIKKKLSEHTAAPEKV